MSFCWDFSSLNCYLHLSSFRVADYSRENLMTVGNIGMAASLPFSSYFLRLNFLLNYSFVWHTFRRLFWTEFAEAKGRDCLGDYGHQILQCCGGDTHRQLQTSLFFSFKFDPFLSLNAPIKWIHTEVVGVNTNAQMNGICVWAGLTIKSLEPMFGSGF